MRDRAQSRGRLHTRLLAPQLGVLVQQRRSAGGAGRAPGCRAAVRRGVMGRSLGSHFLLARPMYLRAEAGIILTWSVSGLYCTCDAGRLSKAAGGHTRDCGSRLLLEAKVQLLSRRVARAKLIGWALHAGAARSASGDRLRSGHECWAGANAARRCEQRRAARGLCATHQSARLHYPLSAAQACARPSGHSRLQSAQATQ